MYVPDTNYGRQEGGNRTALGIFGIVERYNSKKNMEPAKCRPQNTPTLVATLIKHGAVEVK